MADGLSLEDQVQELTDATEALLAVVSIKRGVLEAAANAAQVGLDYLTQCEAQVAIATQRVQDCVEQVTLATAQAADSAGSAQAADTARLAAEAALDSLTDLYLGAKTDDPTTDNDGYDLQAGAMYFRTLPGSEGLRIFNGGVWRSGEQGPTGAGAIPGGTTGQLSRKRTNADYDAEWVTPNKALVGLDQVDNTSDADKPISDDTQTALDTITTNVSVAQGDIDQLLANVGVTIAPLDSNQKVPAANLPSYVDDVLDVATFAALPNPGETGKIYIVATDTNGLKNVQYRWTSASGYTKITASPGTTDNVPEGPTNLYYTAARLLAALSANATQAKTNLALNNVNNTADANKPISSATQLALDLKFPTAGGTVSGNLAVSGTFYANYQSSFTGLATFGGRIQLFTAGVMNVFLSATGTGLSFTNAGDNTYLGHIRNSDGSFIANGSIYTAAGGNGIFDGTGNSYGSVWGGYLSTWVNNQLAGKLSIVGGANRGGFDNGSADLPCLATPSFTVYMVRNLDTSCRSVRRLSGYLEWNTDVGAVGTNYFGSDIKLKENLDVPGARGADSIDRMQFHSFNFKEGKGFDSTVRHKVGVIAQELREIDTTFVTELSDGTLYVNLLSLLNHTMHALQDTRKDLKMALDRIDQLEQK